jgi:hypothetical protein
LIVQGVVCCGVPISVHVPEPTLEKMPKFWKAALEEVGPPIELTLKVALPVPPSWRVSAGLKAITLPLMVEPGCSCSTLAPPLKTMAEAGPDSPVPPDTVPLLITVRFAPTMPYPPTAGELPLLPPLTAPVLVIDATLAWIPAPPLPGAPLPPAPPVIVPELLSTPLPNCTPAPPVPAVPAPPDGDTG